MSNVYISEPPTTGHVILTTNSYGSIDIHLYCKECPTITKYFLQLCAHDYYNNVIFHRILSNLLIQTGLVRYTGDTGNTNSSNIEQQHQRMQEYNTAIRANESYERRQYEIHSRIRFNHRGQVAMALPIDENIRSQDTIITDDIQEMQPQFFITTDEAPYLNGKHVIFGTVVGPTIFNVIRINQYGGGEIGDISSSDDKSNTRMIDTNDSSAPRIISTKIVVNPFEQSMVPKSIVSIPWLQQQSNTDEARLSNNGNSVIKKKKRKGKFDINVLSFGDEIEKETAPTIPVTKKKLESDRIVLPHPEDEASIGNNRVATTKNATTLESSADDRHVEPQQEIDDRPLQSEHNDILLPSQKSQLELKDDVKVVSTKSISAVEAHRAKYLSKKQKQDLANSSANTSSKQQRDDETFNKLLHFRRKIHHKTVQSKNVTTGTGIVGTSKQLQQDNSLATRMARRAQHQADEDRQKNDIDYEENDPHHPSYHGQILHEDDDDNDDPNRWMQTKFVCKKHMDQMSGDNKDAMEEYEVIDPKQRNANDRPGTNRNNHSNRR